MVFDSSCRFSQTPSHVCVCRCASDCFRRLMIGAFDVAQLVSWIHSLSDNLVILPHVAIWPRHDASPAGLERVSRRDAPTFMPKQPMFWTFGPSWLYLEEPDTC